jgi:hypothetical protein
MWRGSPSRRLARAPRLAALGAALSAASPAGAQVDPSSVPRSNDFRVDLFQGVVLAPTRVTSMGGAYAGYAEGTAGLVANAASPAIRGAYSLTWFDWDIDASLSIPLNLLDNDDFDNSGELDADYSNFIYLAGAAQMQIGPFGIGAFGSLQRYTLQFAPDQPRTFVTLGSYHFLAAWSFFENQFSVGGGVRALTLSLSPPNAEITVFGAAPEVGFLIRPDWTPFRFGATYRHAVEAGTSIGTGESVDDRGVRRAGLLVLPSEVELPWEIELGIALQVGARPINPEWIDPDDHETELEDHFAERAAMRRQEVDRKLSSVPAGPAREALRKELEAERARDDARDDAALATRRGRLREERRIRAQNWPREALLLTTDLLVSGPVDDAIGLERFLGQGQAVPDAQCRIVASGERVALSPRFGIEVEPFPGWVHTRFGSYYEPQRYTFETPECDDRSGRQHFTFGADVKLLTTTWFGLTPEVTYKLQGYGDLAPRYQAFGLAWGVWR